MADLSPQNSRIYQVSGIAAWLQILTIIGMVLVGGFLGNRPGSASQAIEYAVQSPGLALLQNELTSVFIIVLYTFSFVGVYYALKPVDEGLSLLGLIMTLLAVAITSASHSGMSLLFLADKFALTNDPTLKKELIVAGEAVLSMDFWNSTGGYISGIMLQGSGVLLSILMLKSSFFLKWTAISGIISNGFDLVQHLLHPFYDISAQLLMVAGPFYFVWYFLLGKNLLEIKRSLDTR
jgi:hypothetical protein